VESFEEVIRHHLRLRGHDALSDAQLRELVGGPGLETEVPPRPPPRPPEGAPTPRGARRLLEWPLAATRRLRAPVIEWVDSLERLVKRAIAAVRPVVIRLALTLIALSSVTILVPAVVAAARPDRIADGLSVGEVPIGGLSGPAAQQRLERRFGAAHREPITVRWGRLAWRFSPSESRVSVDVGGAVRTALEHSRRDPFSKRFLDALRGRPSEDLPAPVSVSKTAVARLADRVSEAVERPPREARVRPSGRRLTKVRDREGVAVLRPTFERLVHSRLASAGVAGPLEVPTRPIEAKVTTADLPRLYGRYVVIRRSEFRLDYFQAFQRKRSYPIAVGKQGVETPAGAYEIQGKQVNPVWSVPRSRWAGSKAGKVIPPGPKNPIKARWMGFDGSAGIHGTTELGSLGQAASHGCVRMSIPDVKHLYRRVRVGTPVKIQ
jgi:L,D-transpeptidase catalytic domain/Putative peptidoglycan binding domain